MITFLQKIKFFYGISTAVPFYDTATFYNYKKKLSEIEFFHRLLLQKTKTKREK